MIVSLLEGFMVKGGNVENSNTKEIVLTGSLSLAFAAEIRTQLLQALDEAETVHISMKDVDEVDLSLIQLLCSAHRSALARKKTLILQKSLPDMFVQIVDDAGFQGHIGCSNGGEECCLWKTDCK
jgi:ABC-type transporter Mla MlaB component